MAKKKPYVRKSTKTSVKKKTSPKPAQRRSTNKKTSYKKPTQKRNTQKRGASLSRSGQTVETFVLVPAKILKR